MRRSTALHYRMKNFFLLRVCHLFEGVISIIYVLEYYKWVPRENRKRISSTQPDDDELNSERIFAACRI